MAYYQWGWEMHGNEEKQIDAFSYVSMEDRIPARHPIRPMRIMVNEILGSLDDELGALYADSGRPSIAPEYLLRASVLQILYSVHSERQLMDQIDGSSRNRVGDFPRFIGLAA
jgi:transposase